MAIAQPFTTPAQATVDVNGNCEFTFNGAPQGYVLTGTITVTNSPANAFWTISINGTPVDVVTGISSATNIQVFNNGTVTVAAANLVPGSQLAATYIGVCESAQTAELVFPSGDSPGYQLVTAVAPFSAAPAGATATPGAVVPLIAAPASGTLILVELISLLSAVTGSPAEVFLIGHSTGEAYAAWIIAPTAAELPPLPTNFSVNEGLDLLMVGGGGSVNMFVTYTQVLYIPPAL
jgi:hypothetical protein